MFRLPQRGSKDVTETPATPIVGISLLCIIVSTHHQLDKEIERYE